jgi:hypothetical protein
MARCLTTDHTYSNVHRASLDADITMGGCVTLTSPGHACADHVAGITTPRGVIPSPCCHTSCAGSARAISTTYSPSAFKANCTNIIIAAKDTASRRLGSLYETP